MSRVAVALLGAGALAAAWMVLGNGLLIEPVIMEVVGPCGPECTRVRCVFENQGPVPSRGSVVIDTWVSSRHAPRGAFQGVRETRPVALGARERAEHVLDVDVPHVPPHTMVRCMPGYVVGGYPLEET